MIESDDITRALGLLAELHHRDLTQEEWIQLEAAGQDDPFLRESVQGLRLLTQEKRQLHLQRIATRLNQKAELSRRKRLIIRISSAAAVLILVIVSWIALNQFAGSGGELAEILNNSPHSEEGIKEQSSVVQDQTATEQSDVALRDGKAEKAEQLQTQHTKQAEGSQKLEEVRSPRDKSIKQEKSTDDGDTARQRRANTSETSPNALGADRQLPVPLQHSMNETAPATRSSNDQTAEFQIQKKDTMPKRKKNSGPIAQSYALAQPLGGWDSYYLFIRQNIVVPASATANNVEGSVFLEFKIDQDGKPFDIFVVESLGRSYDDEAIRLVRAGPSWDVDNAQVPLGRINIDF